VMAKCRGERIVLRYKISQDPNEFLWESEWSVTTFWGWKIMEKKKEDTESFRAVSTWRKGDRLDWTTLTGEPHVTKSAGRYTEASLVKELEKKGVGRPSTFATLISTIEDKKYVEVSNKEARKETIDRIIVEGKGKWPPKEEKITKNVGAERDKLAVTDLGSRVIEFAIDKFPKLFDYGFTCTMEKKLDDIAKGLIEWKSVLKETWESYKDTYMELLGSETSVAMNGGKMKEFSNGLKAVYTKNGPLLLKEIAADNAKFYGWPEGVRWEEIDEAKALEFIESGGNKLGLWKGSDILVKTGKFGKYIECKGVRATYKDCMTEEEACVELEAKSGNPGVIIGNFEIRNGKFGPYMFQVKAKKKEFVSVPKGLNLDLVTEKELEAIFANGLRAKVAYRGGRGGRGGH